jgi:hypothetical protein
MDSLYLTVRDVHSSLRWIVLLVAVIVFAAFLWGWLRKKKFNRLENSLSLLLMIVMDVQLLIGLALYFFLSPITQSALQFGRYQLEDANVRFYALEHPLTMILAIAFAHIGRIAIKKAEVDSVKFRRGTLWFGLSLLFMLSRMPW